MRLVVARLARVYEQSLSEFLDMDVDDLAAWADLAPDVVPKS